MDLIIGNHDTFFKNTNDVNSPELLLNEYHNILPFSSPTDYSIDGCKILLMPWICTDNYKECMEAIDESDADICFAHLELNGYQMWKGQDSHEGFDPALFKNFTHVFTGHFHHRHTRGNITYLGNPYQMFWQDYNDVRGFHILDTNAISLEFIENPKPWEFIEFPISSQDIQSLIFTYNNKVIDFTNEYNKIYLNQIKRIIDPI